MDYLVLSGFLVVAIACVCEAQDKAVPMSCGKREQFSECGSSCPATCDNHDKTRACDYRCNAGCFCDEDYVRSHDGRCVKPSECVKKAMSAATRAPLVTTTCPKNEHHEQCGPGCPITCNNYRNSHRTCRNVCRTGCHCDSGFVRNARGQCVTPQGCQRTVGGRRAYPFGIRRLYL